MCQSLREFVRSMRMQWKVIMFCQCFSLFSNVGLETQLNFATCSEINRIWKEASKLGGFPPKTDYRHFRAAVRPHGDLGRVTSVRNRLLKQILTTNMYGPRCLIEINVCMYVCMYVNGPLFIPKIRWTLVCKRLWLHDCCSVFTHPHFSFSTCLLGSSQNGTQPKLCHTFGKNSLH